VGKQLDEVLQKASTPQQGGGLPEYAGQKATAAKKVNVQQVMDNVFEKEIPDPKLAKATAERFQQILDMTGLRGKLLSELTPMEARTLQRRLDDFANFAPEGTSKSFRDVATKLRRGISEATRKAVPESAPLDQQYSDLAAATQASRRQATEFARVTPDSKLRQWIIRTGIKAGTKFLPLP
jgi:t-SNARE complex subunit (syntaxin)